MVLWNILFYVDSKAVLFSLNSTDSKVRSDIIYYINHLVRCLLIKSSGATFCWIPSRRGLTLNEWWADGASKRGAINNMLSTVLDVPCLQIKCATVVKMTCGNDQDLVDQSLFIQFWTLLQDKAYVDFGIQTSQRYQNKYIQRCYVLGNENIR